MTSILLHGSVRYDPGVDDDITADDDVVIVDARVQDDVVIEVRLAGLVMAVSGCSARRALALIRGTGTETPFDRLVLALAAQTDE